MKKEIIYQKLLGLMEALGITPDELLAYDESIKRPARFPLDVYYSDHTKSSSMSHLSAKQNRVPIGVVIGKTLYPFPNAKGYVAESLLEDYCDDVISYHLKGVLPTKEQVQTLVRNLPDYNRISLLLFKQRLDYVALAIADKKGTTYDMRTGLVRIYHDSWQHVLPVVNL